MGAFVPNVSRAEVLATLPHWGLDGARVSAVRNGENSVWSAQTESAIHFVRFTDERHRRRVDIDAELAFVRHVSHLGLHVADPVPAVDGATVLDVGALLGRPGPRTFAVVFEGLSGRHFEYFSADLEAPLFRLWGGTMARLHEASSTYGSARSEAHRAWVDDPVAGCGTDGVGERWTGVVDLRNQLVGNLQERLQDPRHFGIVHGDLERTNFLIDGDRLGLFDFDDCCRHWFCWDIACALWVFRNGPEQNRADFLRWFLEGYAEVRPLDREGLADFDALIRLRTIALMLYRIRNGMESDPDVSAWLDSSRRWLLDPGDGAAARWSWGGTSRPS